VSVTSPSQNGNLYRAVFRNSQGTATTTAASLAVYYVEILQNTTRTVNGNLGDYIVAEGNPTPAVVWQVSTDGGNTYVDVSPSEYTVTNLGNGEIATFFSFANQAPADLYRAYFTIN
jgi:predicted secreted protein